MSLETITLGGGCFWCIQTAFSDIAGVASAVSGYMGGTTDNPTYKDICTGTTNHAEVVQVKFDKAVIDVRTLLEIFFTLHDPTTLNRQGADVGTQYRSVIFYHADEQKKQAEELILELESHKVWPGPITTQVLPAPVFYPAEDYHQDYFRQNPAQQYCQVVIEPKLSKFREKHRALLKNW